MTDTLLEARSAYSRRDWPRARELFVNARGSGELAPDDLYALGDAAWWVGDNDLLLDACERAYWGFLEADQPRRAALAAMDIATSWFLAGEESVASGWLSRAMRLLADHPDSAEHGYLLYLVEVEGPLGGMAPSENAAVEGLLRSARRVQELGRRHGDHTLVAVGTLGEGRALVKVAQVPRGLALLDEAMLTAASAEVNPAWAGNIYCHLIEAAEELEDYRRAREWTQALTRWLATMPVAIVFNGICRVHRSRVQQMGGAWEEAEREARQVCAELGRLHVAAAAKAHYQVGEIRRLRGDLPAAEQAYQQAHALGRDPQPGLSLLRLAQGRAEVAATSIRAALLAEPNRLRRARLLAAQVEIALATGELEESRRAAAELDEIAALYGSSGLEVTARHAHGAILLAGGRPEEALPILRDACRTWTDVDAPYDCARVRVLLARAYQQLGDVDAARRELEVATRVFHRLGALTDLQRVEELHRPATPPAGLTSREAEVLRLAASGKTNKAIARELHLSERTVARHMANIFAKVGVTSRTAAAAFAFETGLAHPTAEAPGPRPV